MDFMTCDACRQGISPTVKHTCWRRDRYNQSDDEQPPANYHGLGSVKETGYQFEIKMAAVIGLRGLQRDDNFELFSNRDDAGNFDDIVYTAGGRRYFVQFKHTESPERNKLTKGELVRLLSTCFKSYCNIKSSESFKDIAIDNTQFIIYTNKELESKLLMHKRRQTGVDIFFKTCENREIFSFSPDEDKEIDVYTLLENSLDIRAGKMVSEFLNKLIMVTGQKGQRELDEVIAEEIRKHDVARVDIEIYKTELLDFNPKVEICLRNQKSTTATMFRNWLQEAKTKSCAPVVRALFKGCTKKLFGTGIQFSDSAISRLQAKLSDKRAVHLRSDALTLCNILLLDRLDTSKCIFVTFESLKCSKNILLHAWLGGYWEWLIVFCDSTVQQRDISDTCLEISRIIQCAPSSKRIVILTSCSVQQISNFIPIEHKFKFELLSMESREIVLDKKIDFQGCEVTMINVLKRHGNVQHVLGPELVTELVTEGTPVKFGGTLQVNEGYHAPRTLERKIFLHPDVLQNSNDVFAVSGTTVENLLKIVPSGTTVNSFCLEEINMRDFDFTQCVSGRIFLLSDRDTDNFFPAMCQKLEGTSLHWVEFRNGEYLWKKSNCGTESLLDYIDANKTRADKCIIAEYMKSGNCEVKEDSIWDLCERTVLVVAEPGMGKSRTTTQVAWNTKLADPTSWVVRINWNDHTAKLQVINAATFNFDSLVEFLCSAAFTESKYTDTERILLKQALQYSGNVTVLMDGFDEISPFHADKAADILSELMKTKVERVWVTSRPVQKERLERKLSVAAFSMKILSRRSQEEMLQNLWMSRAGGIQPKLTFFILMWKLLRSIKCSVNDENFTGSPLYITMIATIYEMEMEKLLNSEDRPLPKIDLVTLYEKFVEGKIQIYITEKQKADITSSLFQDFQQDLKKVYINNFEKCALVAILPPDLLELLKTKKMEEQIQGFLENMQAGGDKKGMVMNVVDGKPQFVHRTFGEFFTAHWFSRKFESNRSVLERILFDPEFGFVRDMFDRMLAKGCPLHCAVLEEDTKIVKTLLREGCEVNAVDKGGRTVMHIIAIHHSKSWDVINNNSSYEVSLDTRDRVLQWTPLQYAINSENWFMVERLLESNVDRSGLDMIRQRKEDTDYINSIVRHSLDEEHLSLLGYFQGIGVQIPQAVSRQH